MKAKGFLLVIAVALAGSLTVGSIALAQKSGGPTPPGMQPMERPAKTLFGEEISPGDPTASDSPVRLTADSESRKAVLPSTDLGEMMVEGWSTGAIHALRENLDAVDVQRQEQPVQTLSGDELRPGDPTASDSPVSLTADPESRKALLLSTDLGGITVEGWGTGEIRAVRENLDTAGVQREYRKAETPLKGSVPINGMLNPDTAHLYGPYWFNSGDTVAISVSWVPAVSTLRIGLTNQQSGIFYGCQMAGGAGTCQLKVNQAGWYYPTLWNLGLNTVTYSGFVSW
jgi:hypothetical protein